MVTTFESLPNEIHQMVFEHLHHNYSTLINCTLVCKSWNRLFQKEVYTIVKLPSYLYAVRLSKILGTTPHLRNLIKELVIDFDFDYGDRNKRSTITKLFARLPNLESIYCSGGEYCSFLLDAMLLGQMPGLKHIVPEKSSREMRDYTSCALMLKDCLTYLCITDDEYDYNEYYTENSQDENERDVFTSESSKSSKDFCRLFNKLNRFKNIEKLDIWKIPENVIELIETVTQNCPFLQHLNIAFIFENSIQEPSLIHYNNSIISNSLPATKIKSLELSEYACSNNPQLTQYIIHKFPRLENLKCYGTTNYDNDEITFNKVVEYFSKIKKVCVPDISCRGKTLLNSIDLFWNIEDPLHKLSLTIHCNKISDSETQVMIETGSYFKTIGSTPLETGVKMIKKYGKYIENLSLSGSRFATNSNQYNILRPLRHCARLNKLSLHCCMLTESIVWGYETYKKQTFDYLQLSYCSLENDIVLTKLSRLFARTNHLDLSDLGYVDKYRNSGNSPFQQINIKNTDVGILSLSKRGYCTVGVQDEEPVLLVKLSIAEKEAYYKYDFDSMGDLKFKLIDEEQFSTESDRDERFIFGISCKSLSILNVYHKKETVRLTIN